MDSRHLKFLPFALLALRALPAGAATPPTYQTYCMLAQTGIPPQGEVTLAYNDSKDLYTVGEHVFSVSYGDYLGEKNVFKLSIKNTTTNLTTYALVSTDSIPKDIQLTTPELPKAVFSCFNR